MAALPALAALITALLVGFVLSGARRSAPLAIWGLALAQFAAASAVLAWGVAAGWDPATYRSYYLLGAVTNVLWLGLGTVWLLAGRAAAWVSTAIVVGATVLAVVVVSAGRLEPGAAGALARDAIPVGRDVMPAAARSLSRWYSIVGSLVVLAGLVWSIRRRPTTTRGLALVAAGVVAAALAGVLARYGYVLGFSFGLVGASILLFAGFRLTTPSARRPSGR